MFNVPAWKNHAKEKEGRKKQAGFIHLNENRPGVVAKTDSG